MHSTGRAGAKTMVMERASTLGKVATRGVFVAPLLLHLGQALARRAHRRGSD
jgi:hypothetical protein